MAYMKKVSNAVSDSGVGGGWFKIQEDGFDGSKWGVDRLIANKGEQVVTIPSCIAPGQYLLRGELIALHGAGSQKGAQFYVSLVYPCVRRMVNSWKDGMRSNQRRRRLRIQDSLNRQSARCIQGNRPRNFGKHLLWLKELYHSWTETFHVLDDMVAVGYYGVDCESA